MTAALRCGHGGGDPRGCLLCFQEAEAKKPSAQPPPKASWASAQARAHERNLEMLAMGRVVARKDELQQKANATPRALLMHPGTFPDWEKVLGFPVIRSTEVPPGGVYLVYDA